MNGKLFVGGKASSFEKYNTESPVTGVRLVVDDKKGYEAGDMDGNVWELEIPYATQEMADNILSSLRGNTYTGFSASDAPISIDAELGDGITVNGLYTILAHQELTFGPGNTSTVSAPGDDEPEEEYGYVSKKKREETRQLNETRTIIEETRTDLKESINEVSARLTVETDRITATVQGLDGRISSVAQTADSIISTVSGIDNHLSRVEQTADKIEWLVSSGSTSSNFTLTDRVISLVAEGINIKGYVTIEGLEGGTTTIDGSCIKTGTIDAERLNLSGAITFGDLKEDVYKKIMDGGVTEETVKTIITEEFVSSPTIRGSSIYGGSLYDANGDALLSMDSNGFSVYVRSAGMFPLFGFQYTGAGYIGLNLGGGVSGLSAKDNTVYPYGIWDFSNATVKVSSTLSISSSDTQQVQQNSNDSEQKSTYSIIKTREVIPTEEEKNIDLSQENGSLKIVLPDGTTWYLDSTGWHQ